MGDPAGPAVLEPQQATVVKEEVRLAPLYRILVHNDDVTPMDFVIRMLLEVFRKNEADAVEIMLKAHTSGVALVAVLPLEEAEFRVDQAHAQARTAKYPLTFTYEPE
ncbi:MAG: ATP-dependent Clp protease adaptor ClpS [Planctomycetota bacterium]